LAVCRKFLMLECLRSLTLLDPSIMMGEWPYSWGAGKVFCSYQCWSCTNTYSVMRYG